MTIKLRINQKHDPDLHALACRIGTRKFGELVRVSLRSVFDASMKHKARELVRTAPDVGEELPQVAVFRVSVSRPSDMAVSAAVAMVQSGAVGSFARSAVRFALGAEATMGGYLCDAEGLPPLAQDAPVIIVGSEQPAKRRAPRRRRPVAPARARREEPVVAEAPRAVAEEPVRAPKEEPQREEAPAVASGGSVTEDDFLAMIENLL